MARHPSVLITGAGGQVGRALLPLLPGGRFASRAELDVTDADAVEKACRGADVVLHLAANTWVDACEEDPEEADRVNASGTRNVAGSARSQGARVIYVSTDSVFPGDQEREYSEEDPTGPVNVYGRSKLAGEKHLGPGDLIVRSSWIFGEGRNFIRTILKLARSGPVSVVDDQWGRPTHAGALALALVFLMNKEVGGIVHVAGDGSPTTWADLATHALRAAGVDQEVIRIDTPTYQAMAGKVVAPRPRNGILGLEKARSLGVPLIDWKTSVSRYVEGTS